MEEGVSNFDDYFIAFIVIYKSWFTDLFRCLVDSHLMRQGNNLSGKWFN